MINKNEQIVVPILGMHRSGTSMFTRALNILGLELGDPSHLLGAAEDNKNGFWENVFFLNINIEILRRIGVNTNGFDTTDALLGTAQKIELLDPSLDTIDLINRYINDNLEHPIWGWKDPRTVLLFPFWLKLLMKLGYNDIRPAIIVRNPIDTAHSLIKQGHLKDIATKNKIPEKHLALNLWKIYNRILNLISNSIPCFLSFHEWLINPDSARDELERCSAFTGLETDNMDAALKWIDPRMVHHHSNIGDVCDDDAIRIYEELMAKANKQRNEWGQNGIN